MHIFNRYRNLLFVFVHIQFIFKNVISIGGDSTLQLEAAYCVANAAVWEDETKIVSQVASVTGAYLITLLGSGNSSLQEACCWGIFFDSR